MTRFGHPKPWTVDEVQTYVVKLKADMNNPQYHLYQNVKRVWCQKPYDTKKAVRQQPVTENVEAA